MIATKLTATKILAKAGETVATRAVERDMPTGERSMAKTVAAFNALTGRDLSEVEGWVFMAVLKLARSTGGRYQPDDYLDGAAYMALAGEAADDHAERARNASAQ